MRARSREINIFNMSLLDILCGALGAFCFMMLVLLPYYKPPGSAADLHYEQQQTQNLLKELEKLRDAAKDSAFAQQMADMLRKLEAQVKQLQGEVNQFAAQNQQLTAENQNLTREKNEQTRQLNNRRPFLAMVTTDPPQDIDLYVQDDVVTTDKRSNPPFNPAQPRHNRYWSGDISVFLASQGVATWVVRDSPPNVHYKIYVKLAADPARRAPTTVISTLFGETWNLRLPDVSLSPQRFWTLIGGISGEADGKVTFKEATQAERDAEWTRLANSVPPPPAPAVSPGQSVSATATSTDERRALMEKLRQQQQQRQTQQPSPAPANSP